MNRAPPNDMCFLGVFLGAPGGPPAASLGGPRGHGREEGGETAAKSENAEQNWKTYNNMCFYMCI